MAQEKPLDLAVVRAWLAAWGEIDPFSDAAILHLQSLIADTHCLVVITLGVGREPRSLVFRRVKRVVEADHEPSASSSPTFRWDRWPWTQSSSLASSMFVCPVPPATPPIGQLWHQTGVKSERVPKLERVLRWDGADWVIAGYVFDSPIIGKQGKQACDFQEALACAHEYAKWFDCEFIYTYDGSTWGNA
jgi:hypothetical protein